MATLSYYHAPISPGIASGDSWGNGGEWRAVVLVAATCIPDRDKPDGRFNNQNMVFTDS